MTGWLIALGIILLLLCLLLMPFVLRVEYDETRDIFQWKLSWFGIPLLRSDRKKAQRKKKSGAPKQKKPAGDSASRGKKLRRMWKQFHGKLSDLPKSLRWLWKGMSIRGLVIGARVGRFDAKACAIAYGVTNMLVFQALGLLKSCLRVHEKQIVEQSAFGREKTDWVVRGRLLVCPLAALAALLSLALSFGAGARSKEEEQGVSKDAKNQ